MKKIKCFSDIFDYTQPYSVYDEGLRVIRVRDITGSLDKCNELNADFNYIRRFDRGERFRRERIADKTKRQVFFQPIQVRKFDNAFFVIDGHRRTAAAKEFNIEFIDAYVTSYVYQNDKDSRLGISARKQFELRTGIRSIRLSHDYHFQGLLKDLEDFSGGSVDRENAARWKSERFLPACRSISGSKLKDAYPQLEDGDIYVLMHRFYTDYFGGIPEGASFSSLISTFYAARFPGDPQFVRRFLSKIFFRLITGKKGK